MLAVRGSTLPGAAWSPSANGRSPTSLTPPEEHPAWLTSAYNSPYRIKRRVVSRKRGGKRIDILREIYPAEQPREESWLDQLQSDAVCFMGLSPSSTEVRSLAGLELRAALTYDLIRHAWATLEALHPPNSAKAGTSAVRDRFHPRLLQSPAVTAALLAVGAMTSNHSAVVGNVKLSNSSGPDELLALGLGRRREAAVRVLAARSIAIARESGALESTDAQAGGICALLVMCSLYSDRYEPFLFELRDAMRARRKARQPQSHPQREPPHVGARGVMSAMVVIDAFDGLVFNSKLTVPNEDLIEYALDDRSALEARRRLEFVRGTAAEVDDRVMTDVETCAVSLMREVARLQASPLDCAPQWLEAQFAELYAALDLILDLLFQFSNPAPQVNFKQPYHLKIPIILEATLVAIATRHAEVRRGDWRARDLLAMAQRRLLNTLAHLAHALVKLGIGSEQVAPVVWTALDVFPEWVELAIEGARQNGRGQGPLSGTAWTWIEFAKVHNFLKLSTATFASSDAREQRFRAAWEARQEEVVQQEQKSVLTRLAGVKLVARRVDNATGGALAARMVHQALVELIA